MSTEYFIRINNTLYILMIKSLNEFNIGFEEYL